MTTFGQPDLFTKRVRKPPPALERETHIALADLLAVGTAPGWIATHYPLGELRTEKTGALLKRMGNKPGFFDWLLIGPDGTHHWLELKRGNTPLTPAQKYFQIQMNMRGVPCAVARSYEAAETQLKAWGVLRGRVSA
jgi:hypothetical protein